MQKAKLNFTFSITGLFANALTKSLVFYFKLYFSSFNLCQKLLEHQVIYAKFLIKILFLSISHDLNPLPPKNNVELSVYLSEKCRQA